MPRFLSTAAKDPTQKDGCRDPLSRSLQLVLVQGEPAQIICLRWIISNHPIHQETIEIKYSDLRYEMAHCAVICLSWNASGNNCLHCTQFLICRSLVQHQHADQHRTKLRIKTLNPQILWLARTHKNMCL